MKGWLLHSIAFRRSILDAHSAWCIPRQSHQFKHIVVLIQHKAPRCNAISIHPRWGYVIMAYGVEYNSISWFVLRHVQMKIHWKMKN
jgi:hypothetical protein